jgi:hypothetical protein
VTTTTYLSDSRDLLDEQRNQRSFSAEKLLLWELLYRSYLDLNIITYRKRCLDFLESDHYSRICSLLDIDAALVRNAMLKARPHKSKGRTGGRKKKPTQWGSTFDSRSIGNVNNVY